MNNIMTLEEVINFEPYGLDDFNILNESVFDLDFYRDPVINQIFCEEFNFMMESDESIIDKLITSLKKIINTISDFVKKCVRNIKQGLSNIFHKKSAKEAIQDAEEALKENPSLKKVRIEVPDAKKANKEIEKGLSKVESEESSVKSGSDLTAEKKSGLSGLIKSLSSYVGKFGGDTMVIASADTVVKACKSNHRLAVALAAELEKDDSELSKLPNDVKKTLDDTKFKEEVNKAANMGFLKQIGCKIKYFKYRNIEGCTKQMLKALEDLIAHGKVNANNAELTKKMLGNKSTQAGTVAAIARKPFAKGVKDWNKGRINPSSIGGAVGSAAGKINQASKDAYNAAVSNAKGSSKPKKGLGETLGGIFKRNKGDDTE